MVSESVCKDMERHRNFDMQINPHIGRCNALWRAYSLETTLHAGTYVEP